MRRKKFVMIIAFVLTLAGECMMTYAAPETMADGTIFDADYYAENNPDVVAALGAGKDALYQHYVNFGKAEGRKPCADESYAEAAGSSSVLIEPGDENYLRVGYLSTGYNYNLSPYITHYKWENGEKVEYLEPNTSTSDPAKGFVRQDWSKDPIYQAIKSEILALVAENGKGEEISTYSEFTYNPGNQENSQKFNSIMKNLSVDLMKEGLVDNCYLFGNPADGVAHSGYAYDRVVVIYINQDQLYRSKYDAHPEIWGYCTRPEWD